MQQARGTPEWDGVQTMFELESVVVGMNLISPRAGANDDETSVILLLRDSDWLSSPHSLATIATAYEANDIWITLGGSIEFPTAKRFDLSTPIWSNRSCLKFPLFVAGPFLSFGILLWSFLRMGNVSYFATETGNRSSGNGLACRRYLSVPTFSGR